MVMHMASSYFMDSPEQCDRLEVKADIGTAQAPTDRYLIRMSAFAYFSTLCPTRPGPKEVDHFRIGDYFANDQLLSMAN